MIGQRKPTGPELRQQRHESRAGTTYAAFLKDLCADGRYTREYAERAATAVLRHLEERIQGSSALNMEAQLPSKLRDLLEHGEHHLEERPDRFGSDEFIARVADDLGINLAEAEQVALRVMNTVRGHLTEGEAQKVGGQLPADLREFWRRPS